MKGPRLTPRGRLARDTAIAAAFGLAWLVGLNAQTLGLVEWWR